MCDDCKRYIAECNPEIVQLTPERAVKLLEFTKQLFGDDKGYLNAPDVERQDAGVILAAHVVGFLSANLDRDNNHSISLQHAMATAMNAGRDLGWAMRHTKSNLS